MGIGSVVVLIRGLILFVLLYGIVLHIHLWNTNEDFRELIQNVTESQKMKQTKISIRQSAGIIQENTLDKVDFVQLDLLELLDMIGVQEPEPEVEPEVELEPEPTVEVVEKKLEVEKVVKPKKKKVKKIKTIKKTTRPPTKEELLELFNEFEASLEISHHDMSRAHLQNPSQELSVELRRLQAQEVEFGKMQRIFTQVENEYSEVLKSVKSSSFSVPDSDELQLTPSVTKNFTSVVHRLVEILMVKNVSGYSSTELDSLLEDGIEAIKNVQQNKVFLQYLEYLIFEVSGVNRKDNTEISCDSKLSLPTDDDSGDTDDITTISDNGTLDEDEDENKEEEEEEEESIPQDLSDLATKTHLLELGTEMEEALLKRTNQYAEAEDNTEFNLPSPLLPDATLRIQKAIAGKIKYETEERQEKLKKDISTLAKELLDAREKQEESIIEEPEENTCVKNVDHVYNTFKDSIQEYYKQSGSYNASGSKEINGAINVDLKSLVNTPLFFKSILLLDALLVGISGYNEHVDDLIDNLISYVDVDNKGSAENQKTKSFVGYYDDEDEDDENSQFQDDISSIGELLSIHLFNVLSEWEGFEIPEQVTSFYRENLQTSLETAGGLQQKAFFTLARGLDQSIQKSVEFLANKRDYSGDYDYDDGKSLVDRILEEGMNIWEFIVDQVS